MTAVSQANSCQRTESVVIVKMIVPSKYHFQMLICYIIIFNYCRCRVFQDKLGYPAR